MFSIPFSDLLQANESVLTSMITLVTEGNAFIDGSGHEAIAEVLADYLCDQDLNKNPWYNLAFFCNLWTYCSRSILAKASH